MEIIIEILMEIGYTMLIFTKNNETFGDIMIYTFDKTHWNNIENGEKDCFLLTNGLGGFTSLTLVGSVARGDQALLMAAKKAPNVRRHVITNLLETIVIEGEQYTLSSQTFVDENQNYVGYKYLEKFEYDHFPKWTFSIANVWIIKRLVLAHGENTVGVRYEIINPDRKKIQFYVQPMLRDTSKNDSFDENRKYCIEYDGNSFSFNETDIYVITEGKLNANPEKVIGPFYFSQDERDGRNCKGYVLTGPQYCFEAGEVRNEFDIVFSTEHKYGNNKISFKKLFDNELERIASIKNKADLKSDLANELVLASDAYLVNRDSTNGKSIIAGYPFFEDWGRDTMISLPGICLTTKRFSECRQILQTFAKYEKDGLLPNLFPEGDQNPMYNSVDAPLLFINTVYEYVKASKDTEFIHEMYPVMSNIMKAYINGTHFHIKMEDDCLISAGEDLEQLTWMDVRVNGFLPTPRHGKPVEINAYWYNACKIMEELSEKEEEKSFYGELAKKVKESFLNKFWNEKAGCLKDVLSDDYQENQIRPNQVWALTMPYTMISDEWAKKVLDTIKRELYTTVGLRTLNPDDSNFHPIYIGDMEKRDRAYHQGTVWTFPLGAYYRACIRYNHDLEHVKKGMDEIKLWLNEGCVGQLAEIYDGLKPTVSRGCFAQAWSIGELLRAVDDLENILYK